MAILLFILRLIGWVLLAVLLLLLIALFLPLGIQFAYQPGYLCVKARFGPLRFTLWPRRGADTPPKSPPAKAAAPAAPPPTVNKTVEGDKAAVTVKVEPDRSAAKPAPQQPAAQAGAKPPEQPKTEPAAAPTGEKSGGLPFGISAHIDAALQLLSDDPMVFAKCMLGHTGWLGRQLLRAVRVTHLDIFWTVTAEDAAATAELYGGAMALANNLLAFVQQHVRLQSDRLRLEPDFTGQRAGERNVSFDLTSCAAVLLWLVLRLLHRLWRDPQLQPAAKS